MSEILDYANRIKELKERIRTSINNKGISVSTDVPLSEYSAKISLIEESEPIWARNDLTGEIVEGDKVWVSPLSKTSELIYKWYSTTQFNNYTYLALTPYKGFDTLMVDRYNDNLLYNFDQTNNTLNQIDGTKTIRTINNFSMIVASDKVLINQTPNSYISATAECYIQNASSFVESRKLYTILPHQWSYNNSKHTLVKWNKDTGEIDSSTIYGNMTNQTTFPDISYLMYINKNGNTIIGINAGDYYYNKWVKNNETQEFEYKGNKFTYMSDTYLYNFALYGVTNDEKYLFLQYNSGSSGKFRILELLDNGSRLGGIYTDLNIEDGSYTYWYPSTQILINTYNGLIRMWKYDSTNGFVEQTLDFGTQTFSANRPATLNFDASVICVNDNTNGVYLYSLVEQSENNYKVIPFMRQNFNKNSVTGFLTGQKNDLDNTVEVRTLIA